MTVTADSATTPRLGSRLTRMLAGTPEPPLRHSLAPEIVDLACRPVGTISIRLDGISTPAVTPDLTPHARPSTEVPFEFEHASNHALPMGFDVPKIAGTLFQKQQKIGSGDRRYGIRDRNRPQNTEPSIAALLAALLPVLLPPSSPNRPSDLDLPHSLYEFQRDGIEWLIDHSPGALLADDMGLGKTVQAVVALRKLFRRGSTTRALVVAPKSVQASWLRHIRDWAPELEAIGLAGHPQDVRRAMWRGLAEGRAHIGVVTYQTLANDLAHAGKIPFGVVVVDEAQNIKNPSAARSQAMRRLSTQRRWALTGTPLENTPDDLASILNYVNAEMVPWTKDAPPARLRAAASEIMLRRRREEVLTDLPEVTSSIDVVELLPRQRQVYDRAERDGVIELQRGSTTVQHVLALITKLKQICNFVGDDSAKCDWLKDYLSVAQDEGDKVIVFSQYVETLKFIRPSLASFGPVMYEGSMSESARESALQGFRTDPHCVVLLMSLRAGGTGLTITEANRVVHFDSWWNPAVMAQATARVVRIGQEKRVFVSTLISEETIEERIQSIIENKMAIFDAVVNDLAVEGVNRLLTEQELYDLFGMDAPKR